MKSIRQTLVDQYRKIDPSLSERDANNRVTDFGIITGTANERQKRFLSLVSDAANLALAERVVQAMQQIMPPERIYSRDLAVLMLIIINIMLKVEDDKQDTFLEDYFQATSMMLRLSRLEDDKPIDPGVEERAHKAASDMDDILKWFPHAKADE